MSMFQPVYQLIRRGCDMSGSPDADACAQEIMTRLSRGRKWRLLSLLLLVIPTGFAVAIYVSTRMTVDLLMGGWRFDNRWYAGLVLLAFLVPAYVVYSLIWRWLAIRTVRQVSDERVES